MRTTLAFTVAAVSTALGVTAGSVLVSDAHQAPISNQQSRLLARSVLAAATSQADPSPPSGAFLSADRPGQRRRQRRHRPGLAGALLRPPADPGDQRDDPGPPAARGGRWPTTDTAPGRPPPTGSSPIYRIDLAFGRAGGPRCSTPSCSAIPTSACRGRPCATRRTARRSRRFVQRPARHAAAGVRHRPGGPPADRLRLRPRVDRDRRRRHVLDRRRVRPVPAPRRPPGAAARRADRLSRREVAAEPDARRGRTASSPTSPRAAASRAWRSAPTARRLYAMFEGAVGDDDPQDLRIVDLRHRQAPVHRRGPQGAPRDARREGQPQDAQARPTADGPTPAACRPPAPAARARPS